MGVSNWTFQNPHFELGAAKWVPQSGRFKSRHLKVGRFFNVRVSKWIGFLKWAWAVQSGPFKVSATKSAIQMGASKGAFQSLRLNAGVSKWAFQRKRFKVSVSTWALQRGHFKICISNWAFQSALKIRTLKVGVSKYVF